MGVKRRSPAILPGRLRAAVVALALLMPVAPARGDELFEVFVTATDMSGTPDLLVGGSSFPDLLNDLINSQGAFASFAGVAFSADVTFAGVANAINVTFDPVTGNATLTFTILGPGAQTFTFGGADLFGQIEQFLQDNLSGQLTAFLNAINTLSLVAVTDGTPLSTTALSADFIFNRFGLHADLTAAEKLAAAGGREPGVRTRIDAYYEDIDTDVGSGNSYAIAPSVEFVFSETLSLAFLFPIAYHEIEGAQIVNFHANVALPITLAAPGDGGMGFRITPFATFAASGSVDLVAGGMIGGGGVVSTATIESGGLTVSFSNQLSFHEGITLRYEDYKFDPGVSQQILKNGVKISHTFGDHWYAYTTVTETMFLQPAAVDEFLSTGAGFGYRGPGGVNFNFGYSGIVHNAYNSHQIRLSLQMPF